MSPLSQRRTRVFSRQAVVLLYDFEPSSWASRFALPIALDLIGSVVAVNGVSIVMTCPDRENRTLLARVLPAGVELLTPPANQPAIGWTTTELASRGFDRILVVAADVIRLPARVLSTSLSVVGNEGSVRAVTRAGGTYLVGFEVDLDQFGELVGEQRSLSDSRALQKITATRGIDLLTRLSELNSVDEIRHLVAGSERLMPRVSRELNSGNEKLATQSSSQASTLI